MHRILIVDDSAAAARTLQKLLTLSGFEVECAWDGAQGHAAMHAFAPHVVILDLDMPVADGYEFLAQLREKPTSNHVRVIVFTAQHEADRVRLKQLGAEVFCRKGVTSFDSLLNDVRAALPH